MPRATMASLSRIILLSLLGAEALPLAAAGFLPPFLGDSHFLQRLGIVREAVPARQSATHLFTQTAHAAMLSDEGLVLEDVPAFTQYTAFSKDGPSVGQHDNVEFISPAFSNADGAWLGQPQAALMGKVEGRDMIVLVQLGQPVYVPSKATITYKAGQVMAPHAGSLLLAGGAVNKLLQRREGEGGPEVMSIEDAQQGFLMSSCSLFIDAAYSEAEPKPKTARRWLQARSPAPSSSSEPPPLPGWFAPGGPGNPVALANPTLPRGGSTIPGYAVTQGTAGAARQAPSAPGSSQVSASNSFAGYVLVPAPAPGPWGALLRASRFERMLVPALAPARAPVPAVARQVVPADSGNPVLCMTAAGPADCGRAAFGGVGSLGGANPYGGATAASGWLNEGWDIGTAPNTPGGNAFSVNREYPRGGVWGPYHGVNAGK